MMSALARAVAATAILAAVACSGDSREPSRTATAQLLEAKADTGVALRLFLPRDTISAADRSPVELVYMIVNGPAPTLFDNHPHRFSIRMIRPNGEPARSLGGAAPATGAMERFELLLPANGALVQRQDLRCVNDGAYSTSPPAKVSAENCMAMYALSDPGLYKVVVEYTGPSVWSNFDSITAASGRGEIVIDSIGPLVPGIHLSDTAMFVVVDK